MITQTLVSTGAQVLGKRLRAIRTELFGESGLPEMAARLGLPSRTWASYEAGVTVPAEVLLTFMDATGVHPEWLRSGAGPRYRIPACMDQDHTDDCPVEVVVDLPAVPAEPNPMWEAERWALMQEITRLRSCLSEKGPVEGATTVKVVGPEHGSSRRHGELKAVRDELVRMRMQLQEARARELERQDEAHFLRQSCETVRQAAAADLRAAQAKLDALRSELTDAREQIRLLERELDRQRDATHGVLPTELRMRALRQHLQEIHDREEAQRAERQLGRRISRLLSRKMA